MASGLRDCLQQALPREGPHGDCYDTASVSRRAMIGSRSTSFVTTVLWS